MYPVDLVGGNVFAYPFSLEICVTVFLMSCVCLISRVSELKYSSKQELLISLSEAFSGGPSPPLFKNKTWLSLIIPIYEWSDAAKKGLIFYDGESDCHYLFCDLGQINYTRVCHVLGAEGSRDSMQRLV